MKSDTDFFMTEVVCKDDGTSSVWQRYSERQLDLHYLRVDKSRGHVHVDLMDGLPIPAAFNCMAVFYGKFDVISPLEAFSTNTIDANKFIPIPLEDPSKDLMFDKWGTSSIPAVLATAYLNGNESKCDRAMDEVGRLFGHTGKNKRRHAFAVQYLSLMGVGEKLFRSIGAALGPGINWTIMTRSMVTPATSDAFKESKLVISQVFEK